MGQLYINDNLMDFSEKTIIGITKQISDVGSIEKVKGDTTNQFKLPLTKNNIESLGLPGDLNFSGGKEYRLLKSKYVENGVEVIPNGQASIEAVNDYIEAKVLSGNVEFFDLLDGDIADLFTPEFEAKYNFPSLNHTWNRTTIVASLQNTSGFIYPIIDYGDLDNGNRLVDCRSQRPAIFNHSIMERIFARTNFTFIGDVFTDPDYLNEVLPFAGDKLVQPLGYDSSYYIKTVKQDVQWNRQNQWFRVIMPDDHVGNTGGYWAGSRYTFVKTGTLKFKVNALVRTNTNKPQRFVIGLRRNNEGVTIGSGPGSFFEPIMFAQSETSCQDDQIMEIAFESQDTLFHAGDYVELWGFRDGPTITTHTSSWVHNGTTIETILGEALYESEISMQDVVPKQTIKDFLKNWMYRFCLIVQTDNVKKTVTFRPFSELNKNIFKARDWSDKIDVTETSNKEFSIGTYAQYNGFLYKSDENVPETLGAGVIYIDDQTLTLNKTVITSPYAASETLYKLNGSPVCLIRKITPENVAEGKKDFTIKTEIRIVRLFRRQDFTPLLYHQGNSADTVQSYSNPYTYFNLSGQLDGLGFDQILKKRYVELEHTLKQAKRITESIRLNENDIAEFDFFIPVYLRKYAANFYVNKISNYQDGQKTKVELIRL